MELKLQNNINMNYTISPSPSIGDKIQVKKSLGSKLCVIDKITDNKIHVKNNSFGLEVKK